MSAALQRVGVFGGAFDPPHRAHLAVAQAAINQLGLDQLRIIPTGQAWHKSRSLTAAPHRLAMVQLAFSGMPRVVIDERELQRPGPTYTIDTLQALKAEQPQAELYLVMGGDQWASFRTWHRWQEVARLARMCVVDRPDLAPTLAQAPEVIYLQMPASPVSATALREDLARGRTTARSADDLPEPVARYISQHRLYAAP